MSLKDEPSSNTQPETLKQVSGSGSGERGSGGGSGVASVSASVGSVGGSAGGSGMVSGSAGASGGGDLSLTASTLSEKPDSMHAENASEASEVLLLLWGYDPV